MTEFKFIKKTLSFDKNHPLIMGILNTTPDSFSDGGIYQTLDKAVQHAENMAEAGAAIIDVGGESTRPGSKPVSLDEELQRTIPVIEKIKAACDVIISIDTYKSRVADEACKAGAEIINDISGFTFDQGMIEVAARHDAACIIMHIQGTPKNMQTDPEYSDVTAEVTKFLKERAELLTSSGINKIMLDPGFGFGKSLEHNYILLKQLDTICKLGYPVVAGISRKSMIGKLFLSKPVERVSGSLALDTIAILNGAAVVRVHDVNEHKQALVVIEKYLNCSS